MKIYTALNNKFREKFRYKGTYLHGLMELNYQYDIFSFNEHTDYSPGIHNLTINDKDCVFFLWESDRPSECLYRGFLVYSDDEESMKFAQESYNNKKQLL